MEVEQLKVKKLYVEQICIDSPGGSIHISAENNGVGVWLTDKSTGAMVCICAGFQQGAQVSVRRPKENLGHTIALNANKQQAAIQLVDGQKIKVFNIDELLNNPSIMGFNQ